MNSRQGATREARSLAKSSGREASLARPPEGRAPEAFDILHQGNCQVIQQGVFAASPVGVAGAGKSTKDLVR